MPSPTAAQANTAPYRFSVAPMIDWTDKHCRHFHRQLSQHAQLYTEMITTGAILNGDTDYQLEHSLKDDNIVLQLGGSNPQALFDACKRAQTYGYSEYNLNVGCPSDRVQSGKFGACLMAEPELVKECLSAMREATSTPVSAKCRIGIDDQDSYAFLHSFTQTVAESGIQHITVHARKAWLSGLSPKQNREIPPLDYERVFQLKQDFPGLVFSLNGGINSLDECQQHLQRFDGVMLGRASYQTPYLLASVDRDIYGDDSPIASRLDIIEKMRPYIEQELSQGTRLHHISRHMINLYNGMKGARLFRQTLSEKANKPGADFSVIEHALSFVEPDHY